MLVAVGLLLVTGFWDQAVQWLQIHLVTRLRGGREHHVHQRRPRHRPPGR